MVYGVRRSLPGAIGFTEHAHYEYACPECGAQNELLRKSSPTRNRCLPGRRRQVFQKISAAGFALKGAAMVRHRISRGGKQASAESKRG